MASSRKSRRAARSGRARATAFSLLVGAAVAGWLALSGHLFTFTNGSIFGLVLTSGFLTAAMMMALAAAATAFRGMSHQAPAKITDIRVEGSSATATARGEKKGSHRDTAA